MIINQLLSEEVVYAFGWTVLHSLWQATFIAFIIALILAFSKNKAAFFRCNVAFLGLLGVLLSAIITFTILYQSAEITQNAALDFALQNELNFIPEISITTSFSLASIVHYLDQYLGSIVCLWLIGLMMFLGNTIGGLWYVQRLRKSIKKPLNAKWQRLVDEYRCTLNIKKEILIGTSAKVNVPLVIGHLKPIILFPVSVINQLTSEEIEAIICHELAHIYRNDYILNIFQSLLTTLFYYHPAVWWLKSIIQKEREISCDEIAVDLNGAPLVYAKALLQLETYQQKSPELALSILGQQNQLLHRVQRILNHRPSKINIMEKLIISCLVIVSLFLFSFKSKTEDNKVAKSIATNPVTMLVESKIEAKTNEIIKKERNHLTLKTKPIKTKLEQNKNIEPLPKITTTSVESRNLKSTAVLRDTIPMMVRKYGSGKVAINTTKDGVRYKIRTENGEVTYFEVDGKEIPSSEYAKHENAVKIKEVMSAIPSPPPAPPVPPVPAAPPTPPVPAVAPMPPVPPVPPTPAKEWKEYEKEQQKRWKEHEKKQGMIYKKWEKQQQAQYSQLEDKMRAQERHMQEQYQKMKENGTYSDEERAALEAKRRTQIEQLQRERDEMIQEMEKKRQQLVLQMEKERSQLVKETEAKRAQMVHRAEAMRAEQLKKQEVERSEREKEMEKQHKIIEHRRQLNEDFTKKFCQAMIDDGLVKSPNRIKYKLSRDKFVVNGKKQSAAVKEKYIKLWETFKGTPFKGSHTVSYNHVEN